MLLEYNGKQDCFVPVTSEGIEEIKPQCELENQGYTIYTKYFEWVMDELGLQCTVNETEALSFFRQIVNLQE